MKETRKFREKRPSEKEVRKGGERGIKKDSEKKESEKKERERASTPELWALPSKVNIPAEVESGRRPPVREPLVLAWEL